MDAPLISTIMTVYNGKLFLPLAIESILNQSFSNFELIVINDNSTDETQEIIEHFCSIDDRIILINNSKNVGPFISANKGFALARGAYIARMDADDISQPTRFEKQINFLEGHEDIGLLGTNGYFIDENGIKLRSFCHHENDLNIRWELLFNSHFLHSSIMFRRSLLNVAGAYREDHKYAQDYEFYCRLMKYTRGANLVERLVCWRRTSGSISSIKKEEQLKLGTQISIANINQLFGYEYVADHNEILVFRGFNKGTNKAASKEQVTRYLQILEQFIDSQEITPDDKKRFISGVATKLFESIYTAGFNRKNIEFLAIIAKMSLLALPIGLRNLALRFIRRRSIV